MKLKSPDSWSLSGLSFGVVAFMGLSPLKFNTVRQNKSTPNLRIVKTGNRRLGFRLLPAKMLTAAVLKKNKMSFNKNVFRNSFSEATVNAVWNKGKVVPGHNHAIVRKDSCGAWIKRAEYGNTNSTYGWEIDHIKPVSQGGRDPLTNLQPLQWENNRHKGDNYPHWTCKVKAS